jgi:hypothetical protein
MKSRLSAGRLPTASKIIVVKVVQGERAGDAVERPRLQRQRFRQVSHEESALIVAAALRLLDHSRAQIDTDDVGALVKQPASLRAGTASGFQNCGVSQTGRNQRP